MKLEDAKILVVEDSLGMQAYVVHLLKRLNVQTIEVCANGRQALQLVKSFMPDVILSDIHMAPMDGFEFLRKLRELAPNPSRHRTPLIYLSMDASMEALSTAIAQGAAAYIVKPPRSEVLRDKLEQALNGPTRHAF